MADNFTELPPNLPVPIDDGAADHLTGMKLPLLGLPSTGGLLVQLASLIHRTVIYVYPMTGRPGVPLPEGWDAIPGARGCTPQSCGFRDRYAQLRALNTRVFGLSTQAPSYQLEARNRLQLPFELLSDSSFYLKKALHLPTFRAQDLELYRRLTLVSEKGIIKKVFYPVFPPDKNADEVLQWLSTAAK